MPAQSPTVTKKLRRWRLELKADVADDLTIELQLLTLALAAGINDAMTFPDYRVFVSNQTGNTALLAVGALGLSSESHYLPNIAVSLGVFILGGLVFGQIGAHVGRRRKAWLLATNAVQTAIIFVGVALRQWFAGSEQRGAHAWAVIAFLAFASGGQVAMARTVDLPQIPTAMVTSAYVDMLTDPDILSLHNRPRNRRLSFVLCLLVGSFIGACTYAYADPTLALFLAAILKTAVTISFLYNRTVDEEIA